MPEARTSDGRPADGGPPLEPWTVARPRTLRDLEVLVGSGLGPTGWHEVTQKRIDEFAELTGDRQWIHVDVERARAGAFGGTIAHGLYTLSLGPALLAELMAFDAFTHTINYGYEKVRFPAPVPVGSRIRMRATIRSVTPVGNGSAQLVITQHFEREGSDKPVCVAQSVGRFTEGATAD
jgi:acyl dehydratase